MSVESCVCGALKNRICLLHVTLYWCCATQKIKTPKALTKPMRTCSLRIVPMVSCWWCFDMKYPIYKFHLHYTQYLKKGALSTDHSQTLWPLIRVEPESCSEGKCNDQESLLRCLGMESLYRDSCLAYSSARFLFYGKSQLIWFLYMWYHAGGQNMAKSSS